MMKNSLRFSKLRVESLEERTLLAVIAGAAESAASLPEPTEAATWCVETVEDTTGGESFSLRDAIAKAQGGDTVRFVPELSGQTITLSAGQLRVRRGVTVDATDLPGGITIDAGGNSRVFFLSGGTESAPTVLQGLTITGGKDTNNGAGVYSSAGTVALNGCIVAGNTVGAIGGGIYNGGTMTLTNCTVSGNTVTEYHGAIFNKGTLTMTDSVIEGNFGCGIYNIEGTLTITDSLIAGNTADTGGGIYTYNGTITITGSTIAGNTADTGGGIHCYGGSTTITGCLISGNSANDGGGVWIESNGTITVTNSAIFGNSATGCAGGIYKELGSLVTVTSSTISGNSAGFGGGIFTDYGVLSITNSIVSLNYATEGDDIYGNPTFSGNNLIGIDPGFVVPPTFVDGKISNLDELDLSLTAGSWAIDHGINGAVSVETDLAGCPRIRAAWKDIPTVDIGAYEYQGKTEVKPAWTVTTASDVVDDNDGLISLREAISKAKDGETVVFDSALSGGTITLSPRLGGLRISKSIAIDATSIGGITINATEYDGGFYIYTMFPAILWNLLC